MRTAVRIMAELRKRDGQALSCPASVARDAGPLPTRSTVCDDKAETVVLPASVQERASTPVCFMPHSRYPRVGFPIVPRPLRDLFRREGLAEFATLDAGAWRRLGEPLCRQLAQRFVDYLFTHPRLAVMIGDGQVSRSPETISLDDLELQHRTYHALRRAGIRNVVDGAAAFTAGELLQLRGFGVVSLVDLLTSLEAADRSRGRGRNDVARAKKKNGAHGPPSRKGPCATDRVKSPKLRTAAARLASVPGALEATRADPRLRILLASLPGRGWTLGEMLSADQPRRSHSEISSICHQIQAMCRLTVEDEVLEILSAGKRPADRKIIAACMKWPGGRRTALRTVASRFGLTGERVRQIFSRGRRRGVRTPPFAPSLDRALRAIHAAAPAYAVDVARQLVGQGLMARTTPLDALSEWACLLGREAEFALYGRRDSQSVVRRSDVTSLERAMRLARTTVRRVGFASVADLSQRPAARELSEAVLSHGLRRFDGFYWVDESRGVFSLRGPTGLALRIRKVLCVAPRVSLDTLWNALRRDSRFFCSALTPEYVLAFCRRQPEWRVEGATIIAKKPVARADVLRGDELDIVTFLSEHGPLCTRARIRQFAVEQGIGMPSVDRCLFSPAIARYGNNVYGVRGLDVS